MANMRITTKNPEQYVVVDLRGMVWVWRDGTWHRAKISDLENALDALRRVKNAEL